MITKSGGTDGGRKLRWSEEIIGQPSGIVSVDRSQSCLAPGLHQTGRRVFVMPQIIYTSEGELLRTMGLQEVQAKYD